MRLVHQLTKAGDVSGTKSSNRLDRALIFFDRMSGAFLTDRIFDRIFVFFKGLFIQITECLDLYDALQF